MAETMTDLGIGAILTQLGIEKVNNGASTGGCDSLYVCASMVECVCLGICASTGQQHQQHR